MKLTKRKWQVLRRATLTNKQIGIELGIKEGTVKSHFNELYRHFLGPDRARTYQGGQRIKLLLAALHQGAIELDEVRLGYWRYGGEIA